jgi:hypothetical protein
VLLFIVAPVLLGQQVIENESRPLAKNAGRVLQLKACWNISDEGGAFFLKYPYQLQIASDGSVFVADAGQFLKFSAEGRFSDSFYLGPGRALLGVRGDDIYVTEKSADDTIVLVKYKIVG